MIILSPSLTRRLHRETERHIGSQAQLAFYDGVMPETCDGSADGEKVGTEQVTKAWLEELVRGHEPLLPDKAKYWRVYDNGGIVVMQGDGT